MMKLAIKFFFLLSLIFYAGLVNAQGVDITGTVTDKSNGEGIPGVSVKVIGTTKGSFTEIDGSYNLKNVDKGSILEFSSIGYIKQTVKLENQSEINVALAIEDNLLDQVVVVGYGTQKKIDVTGSIVSIKGDDIQRQSSQNALSSIQGKAAGVQITNSGKPGESPTVRIRGTGTAQGGANPLYVVDGVFVDDLSFLNSADIESMEVLKDASSASIYGIRAANGVILVTTKKGRADEPRVEYSGFVGAQTTTNKVQMASGNKYAFLVNEKLGTPAVSGGANTDWYGEILRPFAKMNNHQLSLSGGSEKSTYNFSVSYLNQEGLVKNNNYERITARLQNDINATKNVRVGYNAIFYNFKSDDVPGGIFYTAYVAPPIMVPKREDGSYGDPADVNVGNFGNPVAALDWFNQKSKGQSLTGNAYAEIKIFKDFTFKSSLGLNVYNNASRNYTAQDSLTSVQFAQVSRLSKNTSNGRMWLWENTLNYNKQIGDHRIGVLGGYSAQENKSEFINGSIQDVPFSGDESTLYLNTGNASTGSVSNGGDKFTVLSYFGRINYAFRDKYLVNASLRRDGSSKFPAESRFDLFPSVGLGWIISREAFLSDVSTIDEFKIKASWGRLGNTNIPSNITTQTASYGPRYVNFIGNTPQIGGSITTVVPPTLLWEIVEETDLGFELAMLNNKLILESSVYNRQTNNAIFSVPILGSQGTSSSSILGNYASFKNQGLEFMATYRDKLNKTSKTPLSYNISGNIALNKNRVTSIETGDIPQYGGSLGFGGYLATIARVGSPIGAFYGYKVEGIFQNQGEVEASAQPAAKPGDFKYVDQDGNGVIDTKDKVLLGNPNPRVIYGINTGFSWKNWDLQLDIQGVAGVELYNGNKGKRFGNENYTEDFYQNRWHGEGTSNTYPSANLNGANLDPNSWYIEKGDYIRIRNAQLGYNLGENIASKIKANRARVYLNAQNPLTLFKYLGFTPEISGSPMNAGIDLNVYPLSATYNLGVNLSF